MRLQFRDDGSVLVRTGKVELGQGIHTALVQIAAEALGLRPDQVQVLAADTAHGPDEGVTSGSMSVRDGGGALRQACLEAMAAGRHETAFVAAAARGRVGVSLPRVDLPAKFAGEPVYIHDLEPEGLLHGRVLHPPQPDGRLAALETADAAALPGVLQVHRDGQLVGVLAERSRDADAAAALLTQHARWEAGQAWPDHDAALAALQQLPAHSEIAAEAGSLPTAGVARTLRATYRKPWIAHAALAPSCALARWDSGADGDRLHVWTHSQSIYNLRRDLELALALPAGAVRVQHVDGAGCYGHNGADDVAFDAAWLARRVPGRPVRVLWSRADELSRSPFGPGMVVALEADLDASGAVLHWRHAVWSTGHSSRPGRNAAPSLLGSWQTARPFEAPPSINMPFSTGGGSERNAVPSYALPAWQVLRHDVSGALPRSSALRALGAFANVFAAESFVDEIAHATGVDALAWRRAHLGHDARLLAVLDDAIARSGWADRPQGNRAERADGVGWGIGCARYKGSGAWCAVVAEVEAGAQLRVRWLTIAADVGQVVNPNGAASQIEGGAIQATSWVLKEAVQFGTDGIASDSWARYPILRFSEVPAVDVRLMPSIEPWLGAGEASIGPTAGAIANALHDALGVRVRALPLTPERIVAAMDEGG